MLKGTAASCVSTSDRLAVRRGRSCATRWSGLSRDCNSSNTATHMFYASHHMAPTQESAALGKHSHAAKQAWQPCCATHAVKPD